METTLILGALGALLFCGLVVVSLLMRGRRPELRMGREVDLIDEAEDEETLMRSLEPPRPSPIDRTATILEIEPTDDPKARPLPPDTQRETR
ncbi:hypothetical protein [Methylobacterium goesingense]|jgi:hypothetical protein|uniref:Uncharacterized protein n=1 Tax=Methylobacterium goesingense TaxID=243690 RepID=A0ABV2L0F3_9HYPH|nr:hypothetical protein [Methylobacterium goesingense]GJD72282.1 hypothetical protein CFIICLFH_0495 [Methylobacterium goesingense]